MEKHVKTFGRDTRPSAFLHAVLTICAMGLLEHVILSPHEALAQRAAEPIVKLSTPMPTVPPTRTPVPPPSPSATPTIVAPEPSPTDIPEPTSTATPAATHTETFTPIATNTPQPTATHTPSPTSTPTYTHTPTATSTPEPACERGFFFCISREERIAKSTPGVSNGSEGADGFWTRGNYDNFDQGKWPSSCLEEKVNSARSSCASRKDKSTFDDCVVKELRDVFNVRKLSHLMAHEHAPIVFKDAKTCETATFDPRDSANYVDKNNKQEFPTCLCEGGCNAQEQAQLPGPECQRGWYTFLKN